MNVTLLVIAGEKAGMEIPVSTPEFLIGRGEHCHLQLVGESIGLRHCAISVAKASVGIEDCGSGKGTLLNGKEVQWRREVHDGDQITVGTLVLQVRLEASREEQQGQHVQQGSQPATQTAAGSDEQEVRVVGWVKEAQKRLAEDRATLEKGAVPLSSSECGDSPQVAVPAKSDLAVVGDSDSDEVAASGLAALRIMRGLVASSAVARASAARVGQGLVAMILSVRQIPTLLLEASYAALVERRWRGKPDTCRNAPHPSGRTWKGPTHDAKGSVGPVDAEETSGTLQEVSKSVNTEALWQHLSLRKASQPEPEAATADLASDLPETEESTAPVVPVTHTRHVEPAIRDVQAEGERQSPPPEASREWDRTDWVLLTMAGLMAVGVVALLAPMAWPWFARTIKRHGWPWWAWILQGVVLFAAALALHARQMRRSR